MQRVVDRRQHHADTEPDRAGPLTDGGKSEVGGAVMRPYGSKVMLGKPHAFETLPFGIGDLLQGFVDALRLARRAPRFWYLDLVKQANSHETVPFS